jgi:hypothetical protein
LQAKQNKLARPRHQRKGSSQWGHIVCGFLRSNARSSNRLPTDCGLIANVTYNWTAGGTENQTLADNSTLGGIAPQNETWTIFFSGFPPDIADDAYSKSLNITSVTDLFDDANITNTTNNTNTTLEAAIFNETMCYAAEGSIFDLCGLEYSLFNLCSFFNETLNNVTGLFEYKYVNLNQTRETPEVDFGTTIQTTETLHIFPEEKHTLFFKALGKNAFGGSY